MGAVGVQSAHGFDRDLNLVSTRREDVETPVPTPTTGKMDACTSSVLALSHQLTTTQDERVVHEGCLNLTSRIG